MTSGTRRTFSIAALVLALLPAGAFASHFTGPCSVELNDVELAIQDAVFLGSRASSNESNLLTKLEAAAAKIAQNKPSDAIDKLDDIASAATAWANASKPKLVDASGINTAVSQAIACAGAL